MLPGGRNVLIRPYCILLNTIYVFSFKGKQPLANKGIKTLNLHHPLQIFVITLLNACCLGPIVAFSIISKY